MKLKYRLSAFFLTVIIAGSLTTLVLVRRSAESMFRNFVFAGDSEKAKVYAAMLGDFILENGNWDGVQRFLREVPTLHDTDAMRTLMADRVVLADINGVIVADTAGLITGTVHSPFHLSHGIHVLTDSGKKGTVLVGSMIDSSLSGLAGQFLDSLTKALLLATGISAVIALLLGLAFTARVTKPLGALSIAVKKVASGYTGFPVSLRGRDELSDLSLAFNEMTGELVRLDAAKKQVIADAAHELRTPVTLIQGMVEGMIDGIFPPDIGTLKSVHEETLRLSRLIDTLRELEIIESGELKLALEGVDIGEMIAKAVALFLPAAMEKSISLFYEEPALPPCIVPGDPLRLGEVLYNLISNAIKYSPEGGTVRVRLDGSPGPFVRFSVDDSGPGIAPDEQDKIFGRFYRTDKSRSSASGGRGLGLAIASEIVAAHKGSISVGVSDLGGAGFTAAIPR